MSDLDKMNANIGPRALGRPHSGRDVHMDYTMAAVKSLQSTMKEGQHFRFVYVSGSLVERDQSRTIWLMGDMRRMRVYLVRGRRSNNTHGRG